MLGRHLSLLVPPLRRPQQTLRGTDAMQAVVMVADVCGQKRSEAGYARVFEVLECLACLEKERRVVSESTQARLLAILEQTTDYVAMADAEGRTLYINPAGRALLGLGPDDDVPQRTLCQSCDPPVKRRIWEEAIPAAIRDGVWAGETRLRGRDGREIHASQVIIAHRGAGGAVENLSTILRDTSEQVRTAQALRESHAELQRLSCMLATVQEGERPRIALDLHDGLGQSLSLIKLALENTAQQLAAGEAGEAGESLQQLIPRVRDALAEVRRVSAALRPPILDDLGLLPTPSWLFREFEATCGHIVVDKAFDIAEEDVPVPLQITLVRILQEATHNIVRHAAADRVRVRLERVDDTLRLLIEDNGRGFDPAGIGHAVAGGRGLGLLGMRERAAFSGGDCHIASAPGQGTRVEVSWPCRPGVA